ncbi:hypothetical protein V8C86DRAFT_2896100, partial [Haematococcus lacustris]
MRAMPVMFALGVARVGKAQLFGAKEADNDDQLFHCADPDGVVCAHSVAFDLLVQLSDRAFLLVEGLLGGMGKMGQAVEPKRDG